MMNGGNDNIILVKSYSFALKIIALYKYLVDVKREHVLSRQVLRSGTSIGSNVREAIASESKKDFVHKLGIAVKEARETGYWIQLLKDSQFIPSEQYNELSNHCEELIKILNSIILTTRARYFKKTHHS